MNDLTLNNPHRGHWLVYVNGTLIPCSEVSVSYGVWQVPEATLSFPPSRALQRLGAEDKLEVVVFFLDTLTNPASPEFKLLFDGELIGWSYSTSSAGRRMTFNATADISIFAQLYFFFLNTVDAAVAHATADTSAMHAEPGVFYPYSLFKKGLIVEDPKKPLPPPDVTTGYEILYNVVKGMTSNKIPSSRLAVPMVNFFARWARKRNFVNRFVALPVLEEGTNATEGVFPILRAARDTEALMAMRDNLARTIGDAGSIWDVLKTIFGQVYAEVAMLPTAPCYQVNIENGNILGNIPPAGTTLDPKKPLRLANYFVKPQFCFGIPPTCNIVFRSMVTSHQYSENYLTQPTRVYVNDSLIPSFLSMNDFTTNALKVGYPPEINIGVASAFQPAMGNGQVNLTAMYNAKNVLVFPEELYKGPILSRIPLPAWFHILQIRNRAAKQEATPDQNTASTDTKLREYQKLFEIYARYEYFRQRYEKRGGAVDMAFNPFIVPGFPCVVMDHDASRNDVVGYVMNVTQRMAVSGSTGTMSTSISYGFGRTMYEVIDDMKNQLNDLGIAYGMAPPEPIDQVRAVIQDITKAEELYTGLFYGKENPQPQKRASADLRDLYAYEVPQATPPYPGEPNATDPITYSAGGLDATRELVTNPTFKDVARSYDSAMRYVSRPICTLTEYVRFLHGNKTPADLEAEGQISEPEYYDAFSSAVYYSRIRMLVAGPGSPPATSALGITPWSAPAGISATPTYTGVGADFPQTRVDWDESLADYRDEVVHNPAPKR